MGEIPQSDRKNAKKLDLNALADALEQRGQYKDATELRTNAQKQHTGHPMDNWLDQKTQEAQQQDQREREEKAKQPPVSQRDARKIPTAEIEEIQRMLGQTEMQSSTDPTE